MNDEHLATALSATLPPEGALAARVAQLERSVLEVSSAQITAYHDDRDGRRDTSTALGGLDHRIVALERDHAALTDQIRAIRLLAYVLAGFVVLITVLAVIGAVTSQ